MTREEALKIVRENYPHFGTTEPWLDLEKALATLIPELAESEDDRMIREIKRYIKEQGDKPNGLPNGTVSVSDMIAWLEKQKYNRMQPVYDNQESFESALDKAWKSYNECGSRTVDSFEDDYIECAHAKGFREGYLFGLEEQKEYISNNFDDVWDEEDCEEIITEGQKLTPRFKELLKEVCHAWYDRGAKLEKQKEQKPAEWSEEDEDNPCRVIRVLEDNDSDWKELSNWLKSLRPSWKPSEEQMVALFDIIHPADTVNRSALESLYEQLKKLM